MAIAAQQNNGPGNWGVVHVVSAYGKREQLQDNLSGGGDASRCLKAQRVAAAFPAGPTSRCRSAIVGSDNVVFIIPKRKKACRAPGVAGK